MLLHFFRDLFLLFSDLFLRFRLLRSFLLGLFGQHLCFMRRPRAGDVHLPCDVGDEPLCTRLSTNCTTIVILFIPLLFFLCSFATMYASFATM